MILILNVLMDEEEELTDEETYDGDDFFPMNMELCGPMKMM